MKSSEELEWKMERRSDGWAFEIPQKKVDRHGKPIGERKRVLLCLLMGYLLVFGPHTLAATGLIMPEAAHVFTLGPLAALGIVALLGTVTVLSTAFGIRWLKRWNHSYSNRIARFDSTITTLRIRAWFLEKYLLLPYAKNRELELPLHSLQIRSDWSVRDEDTRAFHLLQIDSGSGSFRIAGLAQTQEQADTFAQNLNHAIEEAIRRQGRGPAELPRELKKLRTRKTDTEPRG